MLAAAPCLEGVFVAPAADDDVLLGVFAAEQFEAGETFYFTQAGLAPGECLLEAVGPGDRHVDNVEDDVFALGTAHLFVPRLFALLACSDQLGLVLDAAESVFGADLTSPVLERAVVNLDDRAALAADQVVVMAVAAGAVGGLAAGAANRVDLAVLGQAAEVAVDRRKADLVEPFVQFLRRESALALGERLDDRGALNRRAAARACLRPGTCRWSY